jgi:hypothetical protein
LVFDSSIQIFSSCRPEQVDLGDVRHAVQVQLEALGVVLHRGVVEAFAGERVDVAEGVAELVVVEGPDDAGRQVLRMSPTFLRTWYQSAGMSRECIESRAMNCTSDSPGREYERMNSYSPVSISFFSMRSVTCCRLPRGRARPEGAHDHDLEGEGRVFRLAQALVAPDADQRQHDHREAHRASCCAAPRRRG